MSARMIQHHNCSMFKAVNPSSFKRNNIRHICCTFILHLPLRWYKCIFSVHRPQRTMIAWCWNGLVVLDLLEDTLVLCILCHLNTWRLWVNPECWERFLRCVTGVVNRWLVPINLSPCLQCEVEEGLERDEVVWGSPFSYRCIVTRWIRNTHFYLMLWIMQFTTDSMMPTARETTDVNDLKWNNVHW